MASQRIAKSIIVNRNYVYSSTVIWELKLKNECFDVGWAYFYLHNTFFNIIYK